MTAAEVLSKWQMNKASHLYGEAWQPAHPRLPMIQEDVGLPALRPLNGFCLYMINNLVVNPRRMREGYGSRFVCVCVCVSVCVCVCYHTSCYIPHLYIDIKVPLGFLWRFQDTHCVDFIENALFKSSGDIC